MFNGFYGNEMPEVNVIEDTIKTVFTSEDSLTQFVNNLTPQQRSALYEYMFNLGVRYTGHGIAEWRKSK